MFRVLSDPAIYEFENEPPESVERLRARYAYLEARRSPDGSQQWLNWVLRLRAGDQVFRLGDIATVKEGLEDPYQRKFRFNGHDSVQLGVVMANGYKVTDVGHAVEETYKRFEETLPVGVQVEQISNQPEVVTEAVGEFTQALLEALVIVLVVSLISIGWRSGIVIHCQVKTSFSFGTTSL